MLRFRSESERLRGDPRQALVTAGLSRAAYAGVDPQWGLATAGVRAAIAHQVLGELDLAAELAAAALRAARLLGHPMLLANALQASGAIRAYEGHPEAALPLLQEALGAYTAAGCDQGEVAIQGSIGLMLKRLRRFPEAQVALVAAQQASTALGDRSMQAHWDSYLAEVLAAQGEYDAALALAAAAVAVQQESGDRHAQAVALTSLAVVTEQAHGPTDAVPILEQAVRAFQAAGMSSQAALQRLVEVCRATGDDAGVERHNAELARLGAVVTHT